MKNILQKTAMLFLLAGAAFLASCYPDNDISVNETDIVITVKDDTVNFANIKTYFMPEKVFLVDTTEDHDSIEYEDEILTRIAENMADYGYTRITDTTNAQDSIDVVIIPSVFKSTVTSVWYPYYPYYPGWENWFWWEPGWSFYPPGWSNYSPGYYPPYYPNYPYISQYIMGTVMIDMIDPRKPQHPTPDSTIYPNYWEATIHGLLQGDNIEKRIIERIDKAFELSPYLNHNN